MVSVALLFAAVPVLVPSPSIAGGNPQPGLTLPGSSAPAAPAGQTCVQVEIAGQKPSAYNCLNQELRQQAVGAGQSEAVPPLSATSPSNQAGTFNEQGVAEQYGQNFRKSAIPYRPPPPIFNNALTTPH